MEVETQNLSYSKQEGDTSKELGRSKTVPDYLFSHYKNQPDRIAVSFVNTVDYSKITVTFKELYEKSTACAKSIVKLGVKRSEFVAVSLMSSPEWLYTVFGAMMAAAKPIFLSFTYSDGSDVIAMIRKLQTCSAIVLDSDNNWNILRKLVDNFDGEGHLNSVNMPSLRYLILSDKPNDNTNVLTLAKLMDLTTQDVSLPLPCADDIAAIFQTSGSTGTPKAVAHTHRSLIASAENYASVFLEPYSSIFFDRPFTWSGGFPITVITGQTRVTISGLSPSPEDAVAFHIKVLEREQCEVLPALPHFLNSLMERQVGCLAIVAQVVVFYRSGCLRWLLYFVHLPGVL